LLQIGWRLAQFASGASDSRGKSQQACAAFCPAASPAALVARLLIVLAPPHFLLDARVLDEFPESLHGIGD
jgi:hypothetical protein